MALTAADDMMDGGLAGGIDDGGSNGDHPDKPDFARVVDGCELHHITERTRAPGKNQS